MYEPGTLLNEIVVVPIATNPRIEYGLSLPDEDWLDSRKRFLSARSESRILMQLDTQNLSPVDREHRRTTLERLLGLSLKEIN
ncbi:hypothetical protein OKW38_002471 [Paraburkholderia sp. MM5496-R1]